MDIKLNAMNVAKIAAVALAASMLAPMLKRR